MRLRAWALAALAAAPGFAGAQNWRTLDVSRQLHDTSELHVHVEYGVGRFDLRGATTPVLYSMELRYDDNSATPLHRFDGTAGTLDIGVKDVSSGSRWMHRGSDDANRSAMRLALAPEVPLDLTLSLGATEAHVDLGGLTLRGLHVESGAAEETIDFSTPNRARMGNITVDVGAAGLTARNLANANASTLRVHGGVSAIDLGFGGQWTGDIDAEVQIILGKVTLRVPRDVGVRLDMQRFLTSFDNDGLEKRDGSYYSANWDTATYHLRVHVQTTFGGIVIDRFGDSGQP
jgi:hypothetical protein